MKVTNCGQMSSSINSADENTSSNCTLISALSIDSSNDYDSCGDSILSSANESSDEYALFISANSKTKFFTTEYMEPTQPLNISTMDPLTIVRSMILPTSGLSMKNRIWLKIPIPMSFLGRDLVDWLTHKVIGLEQRKDAKKYASKLLTMDLIRHVINSNAFSEQCYYVIGTIVFNISPPTVHRSNLNDSNASSSANAIGTNVRNRTRSTINSFDVTSFENRITVLEIQNKHLSDELNKMKQFMTNNCGY